MVYAKFGGQTECIMGNWKIENFKTDHRLHREENKVEFLEGQFLDEKLPFLHKKKAEQSFELSLSIFGLLMVYF